MLEVDPRADAAITEAVEHGIEVVLVLDKGNWVHAPEPRRIEYNRDLVETYYNSPPWPDPATDPEYFEAWLNYVRFMVRHFKDRVRYFEIWNEWDVPVAPDRVEAHRDHYCRLAAPTARAIRDEHPEARIVTAGTAGMEDLTPGIGGLNVEFIEKCVRELGDLIDAVGFHPYYNNDPQEIRAYAQNIASLRQRLAQHGFDGEMMASEWSWFAPYPQADQGYKPFTEIQKAKIAARFATACVAQGIQTFWNARLIRTCRAVTWASCATPSRPIPSARRSRSPSTTCFARFRRRWKTSSRRRWTLLSARHIPTSNGTCSSAETAMCSSPSGWQGKRWTTRRANTRLTFGCRG